MNSNPYSNTSSLSEMPYFRSSAINGSFSFGVRGARILPIGKLEERCGRGQTTYPLSDIVPSRTCLTAIAHGVLLLLAFPLGL